MMLKDAKVELTLSRVSLILYHLSYQTRLNAKKCTYVELPL